MQIYPSIEEFSKLAEDHNIIPLVTEIPADLETPISLYLKLVGSNQGFMLESADNGRSFGRYSYIGLNPIAEVASRSNSSEVLLATGEKKLLPGKPLDCLQEFMSGFSIAQTATTLPFASGLVGYFAYDLIATIERIRGYRLSADLEIARLLFCQVVVIFDHLKHTLQLVYLAQVPGPAKVEDAYAAAIREMRGIKEKISTNQPEAPDDRPYQKEQGRFSPPPVDSPSAQRYMAMVRKAKEYITAGDAFQIVVSQEFDAPLRRHPFNLYRRLRQVNPSPYMFYLNYGEKQLVGASPEMLVKIEDNKVYTCPIAGTRPRGRDSADDERLAAELLADEKERAEHAMLVDLGRNDLGRISVPGTVTVDRYMEVEKFSHVMHLVSLVSGKLDSTCSALDALQACFPAGTVSGAPKVRAMEIIHELEGDCRGAYAGAVGYIDFHGNMNTCITIRTMVIDGKRTKIRTGAGIVYDSVPETEYQEVLHKGRALFKLMEDER